MLRCGCCNRTEQTINSIPKYNPSYSGKITTRYLYKNIDPRIKGDILYQALALLTVQDQRHRDLHERRTSVQQRLRILVLCDECAYATQRAITRANKKKHIDLEIEKKAIVKSKRLIKWLTNYLQFKTKNRRVSR